MSNLAAVLLAGSLRLEALNMRVRFLKRGANGLIYASVLLGVALLAQLYALMVPSWLLYSILAGWVLYVVVAVGVATGREKAYLQLLSSQLQLWLFLSRNPSITLSLTLDYPWRR